MKIYSSILTPALVYAALRESNEENDVIVESFREFSPRKGGRGFELYLEGLGARHKRARNGRGGKAATWDDYGLWMARLFKIDPAAKIAHYDGLNEFIKFTTQYIPRGQSAPWLKDNELVRLAACTRLEELRIEIQAERISYGEIAELQGLAEYIEPGDVELLEWAGVPEFAS